MKKIIMLCLTCILALSSAAVCFAEEGADPVETVTITIQIEGVDETVLYEEVEVQLGEEDIYLSDLLEQLDEKYDDLEIVIENNMVVSVNGVEEIDNETKWCILTVNENSFGFVAPPVGHYHIHQWCDGNHVVITYCSIDEGKFEEFAVLPISQESYKDGKMSFYAQRYLDGPAPKVGLNVALTGVASGETEEYVTDENGEIDLSETKLSGEVYVNYWQKDADGNPLALRPLKNEYTIVLPEIAVDNEPDVPVAPETADSTALLSLAAVAMFTLTVFFALRKKQSDVQ